MRHTGIGLLISVLALAGCGGGGGGSGGGPDDNTPDPELRSGPLMFSHVAFIPRNSINSLADFDEDGLADLLMLATDQTGTSTEAIYLRLGSSADLFGEIQAIDEAFAANDGAAIADFNGDNHLDIALGRASLYILQGNGDGTFDPEVPVDPLTGDPDLRTPLAVDLDADGDQDILAMIVDVPLPGTPFIAAYINNGTGTFTRITSSVPNGRMLAGNPVDFDQDGNLDLAVITEEPEAFAVCFGNGSGGFTAPIVLSSADFAADGVTGDLNGDGNADFVAIHVNTSSLAIELTVHLGAGDGTFTALSPNSTGILAIGIVLWKSTFQLDEVTGDGMPDLLISIPNWGHWYFEGNGDGTFNTQTLLANTATSNVLLHDFTGDGIRDAYAGVLIPGILGGGFVQLPDFESGGVHKLVSADVDMDGFDDLLGVSDVLKTFLSNGDGTFDHVATDSVFAHSGEYLFPYTADLDSDGYPDFTALLGSPGNSSVAVLLNDGNGAFTVSATIDLMSAAAGWHFDEMAAPTDLDGDGILDLYGVVRASANLQDFDGTVWVAFGNGDGTYQSPTHPFNDFPTVVTSADFDGDGRRSLVFGDANAELVRILHTQTNRSFTTGPILPGGGSQTNAPAAGRLDNDSRDDLAIVQEDGIVALYYGNGSNGVDTGQTFSIANSDSAAVILGPEDAPQIVVASRVGSSDDIYRVRVTALERTGSRQFSVIDETLCNAPLITDGKPQVLDLNMDGFLDLITPVFGAIEIMRGADTGGFDSPLYFDVTPEDTNLAFALGDWDADGDIDMAVPNINSIVVVDNQFFE